MENSLTSLADQINPAVQAFSDGLQEALNSVSVPAQLADVLAPVSGAFSSADTSLPALVDDEVDPAIQASVYDIGDPLRDALTSLGAPDQLADGVYALEQVLPTLLEVPNDLLTNGVHFAATGLQDLVANNFDGFVQELELIPTGDLTLSLFGRLLPLLGIGSAAGWSFAEHLSETCSPRSRPATRQRRAHASAGRPSTSAGAHAGVRSTKFIQDPPQRVPSPCRRCYESSFAPDGLARTSRDRGDQRAVDDRFYALDVLGEHRIGAGRYPQFHGRREHRALVRLPQEIQDRRNRVGTSLNATEFADRGLRALLCEMLDRRDHQIFL